MPTSARIAIFSVPEQYLSSLYRASVTNTAARTWCQGLDIIKKRAKPIADDTVRILLL